MTAYAQTMRDVEVLGVRLQLPSNAPVVLLRDPSSHEVLPLWVGSAEAAAIAFGLQGIHPDRPLTHDLMLSLIRTGSDVRELVITELRDSVFLAVLVLADGTEVDCRPSDGIAVAVRCQAPVRVAEDVWAEAAMSAADEDEVSEEVDVEQFRAFLDTVSPEDFDNPGSGTTPSPSGEPS